MNRRHHFIITILMILVVFVSSLSVFVFDIKDMTAVQGEISGFNDGWTLIRPDGSSIVIDSLPYNEPSKAQEVFYLEKDIHQQDAGKTIRFLSADKTLSVTLDGATIYEFGIEDKRLFGHTPGSITNFVKLPKDIGEGHLSIRMESPYDGYASNICEMVIGDADEVELELVKSNLLNYLMCMIILFAALMLVVIEIIELFSRQKLTGSMYLGFICFFGAIYHAIETKSLNIFYGNQTLYSILVFVVIMLLPALLCLYYICNAPASMKKRFEINFYICAANIVFQLLVQTTDIADFMSIAPLSHLIIGITVINVDTAIIKICRDSYKETGDIKKALIFEMIGVSSIMIGSLIDIVRFYVSPVGDMGRYGRLGMLIFSVITLSIHIVRISERYLQQVEKNMNLMESHLKEAEAANLSKSMFLANMSHEIRTPMNSITGFSEILLKMNLSDDMKEYVENIRESSYNLLSIINDILDISKIESGKIELVETDFSTVNLLNGVCKQIKSLADKKGLEYRVDISCDLPSKLHGDEVRIREVLINILSNAVKYTTNGSVTFAAECSESENGMLNLIFKSIDTGIGISSENKDVIFRAFEQADKKKNHGIEGTGLGLSIVKSYVELMKGSITVDSEVGKGSTFIVCIPVTAVSEDTIGEFKFERTEKAVSNIGDIHIDGKCALVVDDSIVNLKVISRTLQHYGISVDTAAGGEQSVAMCKEKIYDYVFMDQMMPVMNGVEAMHIIRTIPGYEKGSDSRIFALTANAIKGVEEELIAEGFDEYLKKPIEFAKLEKVLTSC